MPFSIQDLFGSVWSVILIIFFFGGSIFFHELGHFLAAKARGLKIERFSIGFGPRIFGWTRNGVDYRLSLLPLGGYVALPQLADMGRIEGHEDEDTPRETLPPITFSDKVIVAVMGPIANILFALVLASLLWIRGQEVPAAQETTTIGYVQSTIENDDGVFVPSPAALAGLQAGDRIISVDGDKPLDWIDLNYSILAGGDRSKNGTPRSQIVVERDGEILEMSVSPVLSTRESIRMIGIAPSESLYVARVEPGLPAAQAGLRPGDDIVALDGTPLRSFTQLREHLTENQDRPIAVTINRDGQTLTLPVETIIPPGETFPRMGFQIGYESVLIHRNPIDQIGRMVGLVAKTLTALINPSSDVKIRNLSGPPGIINAIHEYSKYGFWMVVWFVTFINVNLAMLNLLPIPVLDGGHILFATIAKIRGKALPRRFIESTQGACMILLFALIIYISFFDFQRIFSPEEFSPEPPKEVPGVNEAPTPSDEP